MKKRNKKKRSIHKVLFSYLPLFFITVSILVFIFFLMVNEISERDNKRANEQFANHTIQLLDNEMTVVNKAFLNEIYFATETQLFFNPLYRDDTELNYDLSKKLRSFVNLYNYIDSIYLYRDSDEMVLSNNIMLDANLYGDIEFIRQEDSKIVWSQARMFKEVNEGTHERMVISIKRPYPLVNDSKGFLVMNISLRALQQYFQEISQVDLSFVHVKDQSGAWIMGNISEEDAKDLQPDLILSSNVTGWTLYSGLNEHYFFQSLKLISRIWIVSGVLIIISGCIWLIYLNRRNYRPVEALVARIETFSLRKSMELKGNYDDFQFIENTLNMLLEETQSHHKQLRENMHYKEIFLFQGLIEGGLDTNIEKVESVLLPKGFALSSGDWRIVLYEIDRFWEFEAKYKEHDQTLLKFALECAIEEMAAKFQLPIWLSWVNDKQIGALFQVGEDSRSLQILHAYFSDCIQWVETNLHFTITIAKGGQVEKLDHIYLSFDQSAELMELKPSIGNNRWIDEFDIAQITKLGYYHLIPKVHLLTDAYKLGDSSWEEYLESICDNIQENFMARNEIVNLFEYLLNKLNSELIDVMDGSNMFWNEEHKAEIQFAINSFDTTDDLLHHTKIILSNVFEQMLALRKQNSHHHILDEAQTYLQENFADANLSLNLISDKFNMTPAYFSRIFKIGTGERFVDCITRLRIEEAKRLLSETKDSIQDIGYKVGYVHAVSFNRAFKKNVGITPGDYRNKVESKSN